MDASLRDPESDMANLLRYYQSQVDMFAQMCLDRSVSRSRRPPRVRF